MGKQKRAKIGEPMRYLREVVFPYKGDTCLPWPYAKSSGYGVVKIDGKDELVHIVVCRYRNGPPPTPKHEVAHGCGKGHEACCAGNHLSWKTREENHADKLIHGTHNRGERHGMAKLTSDDVRFIKAHAEMRGVDLAAKFHVHPATICFIRKGRSWQWLS